MFTTFLRFLLVIGCQDIVVGIEESVERLDSMTSRVTCQSTGHTTVLTCKDNTWIGQRHPCPLGKLKPMNDISHGHPCPIDTLKRRNEISHTGRVRQ